MIVVAFTVSIIASLIIGFDAGTYFAYKAFHDDIKKRYKKEDK